jgi:tellurite resistance protein TehA-like permease
VISFVLLISSTPFPWIDDASRVMRSCALAMESAMSVLLLLAKIHWRDERQQQRAADVMASALRKAPL